MEIGVSEIGAIEAGVPEIGVSEIGAIEIGALEIGALEIGALEIGAPEIYVLAYSFFHASSYAVKVSLKKDFFGAVRNHLDTFTTYILAPPSFAKAYCAGDKVTFQK